MFYLSLHWRSALFFTFSLHFCFPCRLFSAEYCFFCFLSFIVAFSSHFLLSPDSFWELLELPCWKAICSKNIYSRLQTSLSAIPQSLTVAYSSIDNRHNASLGICHSTIRRYATPLIPTWVFWFSISSGGISQCYLYRQRWSLRLGIFLPLE